MWQNTHSKLVLNFASLTGLSNASVSILYKTDDITEPIIVPATPKKEVKTATKADMKPTSKIFL